MKRINRIVIAAVTAVVISGAIQVVWQSPCSATPAVVSTGADSASTYTNNAQKIVRDSSGNLYFAYWKSSGGFGQIFVSKSIDNGASWNDMGGVPISTVTGYDQNYPSIALDSADNLHVVWYGADAGNPSYDQIKYSKYSGGSWSAWTNIQEMAGYEQWIPSIAVDSADNLHVVWSGADAGNSGNQIKYSKYSGGSWSAWTNIQTVAGYEQTSPSIAVDSADNLHVVWHGVDAVNPTDFQIKYSKYSGGSWSAWTNIQTVAGYMQYSPSIAVDSADNLHVVWQGLDAVNPTYSQIKYSKYSGGSWSAWTNLSTVAGYNQLYPSIAVDYQDRLHVFWYGRDAGSAAYYQIKYSNCSSNCDNSANWSAWVNKTSSSSAGQQCQTVRWSRRGSNGGNLDWGWTDTTATPTVMFDSDATYNMPESIPPTITDNQSDDDTWYSSVPITTLNVDFYDTGGSHLDKFQTRACTTNTNCGDIIDWTDAVTGISPADSYTADWSLPTVVWDALPDGTSYISVRVFDVAGNETATGPVFYMKKDATPPDPVTTVNDGPGEDVVYTNSTTQIDVNWSASSDALSGLSGYYYAIGASPGATDVVDWTSGGNEYSTNTLKTGLGLSNGLTYYFSVRAKDEAGNYSTPANSDGQTIDATLAGGDHGGVNWSITANSEVSGAHTNIATFSVPAGVYVYVAPYYAESYGYLDVTAVTIQVDGAINADGRGYRGGGSYFSGSGCTGAGGGYGGKGQGNGGCMGPYPGGAPYGTATGTDIGIGSGGGGNATGEGPGGGTGSGVQASTGGRGGGYIKLWSTGIIDMTISGELSADGWPGLYDNEWVGRGACGSGGGVMLQATGTTTVAGVISADGACPAGSAGAGGGGRVKLFGLNSVSGKITAAAGTTTPNGYGYLPDPGTIYIQDSIAPTITDNQTGDDTWRTSDPGAIYDVDFSDTGGSNLNNVQYAVWDAPNMSAGTGTEIIAWTDIATGINTASYTTNWGVDFASLTEGTNYVSARAFDNASNPSAVATDVFYINKDSVAPTFDGITTAVDCGDGGCIDIAWATATDVSPPITYNIYIATSTGGQNFASPYSTTSVPAYSVTGLANGVPYYTVVRAEDSIGNEDTNTVELSAVPTDVTPPDFGGLLSAADDSTGGSVVLSWAAATDNSPPITYNIYYNPGASIISYATPQATIAGATATQVTGLTNNIQYAFAVRAEDFYGNRDANVVQLTATPTDVIPPSFGGISSADDDGMGDSVTLSWAAATDNSLPISYNIYQATSSGSQNFASWSYQVTAATGSQISGLTNGQPYYFVVRAEDAAGNEETNIVEASATPTLDVTPPTVTDNQTGDDTWRTSDPGAIYDVDFADGGSLLNNVQYAVWDAPNMSAGSGTEIMAWTDIATGINAATYTTNWGVNFSALASGTNYVSARAYDNAGNPSAVATDVFYIKKGSPPDTTAPTITDNQTGDDTVRTSDPGAIYNVDFADSGGSNLNNVQYAVWSATGMTGTNLIVWSNITTGINAATYTTNWGVNFASLTIGTNYVSARAFDNAGNFAVATDVFYIKKGSPPDTTLPTITDNQTGDDTVRATNNGTYNVDFADTGGSHLSKVQVRACSTDTDCGDIIDWTDVVTGLSADSYTTDWPLPAAVWSALPNGPSFISVKVFDGAGNTAEAVAVFYVVKRVASTISVSVTPRAWNQIAMPLAPDATTFNYLMNTSNFDAYIWDPRAPDDPVYYQFRRPSSLIAGQGLWVYPKTGAGSVSLSGVEPGVSDYNLVPVYQGWNQVGTPRDQDYNWNNICFAEGEIHTTPLDAVVAAGKIARYPFYYDTSGNTWRMLSGTDPLTAGTGYMVYSYTASGSLHFHNWSAGAARQARVIIGDRRGEFQLKISAAGARSADPDNFIALNLASLNQFDGEDIVEPPAAFGQFRTSLYFPHDDWPKHPGKYARDFRSATGVDPECGAQPESNVCKVWDFKVATNESGTTMRISWDSLADYDGRYEAALTDLATGAKVDMIASGGYTYATNGAPREFRITVVKSGPAIMTLRHSLSTGWNLISTPLDPPVTGETGAAGQVGDDLNALNIFQYYDGKFYTVRDAEGVDIQTGVGYWVYSDGVTEIDITGFPAQPDVGVSVPLKPGWNLIGNPFETDLAWSGNIGVTCYGAAKPLSAAAASGWIDGAAYEWNGGGYVPVAPGGILKPWTGYFLRAAGECVLNLKK